jgi:hypothetical protein
VLYVHGGVYADTDVECRVPVDQWHERHPNVSGAGFVTGAEAWPVRPGGGHRVPVQVRRRGWAAAAAAVDPWQHGCAAAEGPGGELQANVHPSPGVLRSCWTLAPGFGSVTPRLSLSVPCSHASALGGLEAL